MVKSVTAVVTVAANNSFIWIEIERTTGVPGAIKISGTLRDSAGSFIDGVSVKLNINGLDKATKTTNIWDNFLFQRNINFEYTFPAGTFDIYVYWAGNATYFGSDSNVLHATYTKIPTVISPFTVTPTTGAPPLDVDVYGLLKDNSGWALVARLIDIYRNNTKIKTVYTSMSGVFEYSDTVTVAGVYNYYAQFAGDETYAGCEEEPEACEILPCPACGHPVGIRDVGVEVSCGFCGATSEIIVNG